LAREVLRTERDTVIELRNKEAINDQALRRIQREMEHRHHAEVERRRKPALRVRENLNLSTNRSSVLTREANAL